ncbi:MAG: c-type cytochrome, partial [Planctomycetota bacterium]
HQSPNNLFASADAWTSPVCAEVGPDGAVWICDWYNLIVQHNPTPTRSSAGVDAKTGRGNAYETPLRDTQHGRIYRIVPKSTPNDTPPNLASADPHDWLAGLSHGNLLWRLHAQRRLVERADPSLVPDLQRLVSDEVAAPHALHALAAFGALTDELLERAMHADRPAVRTVIALANVALCKRLFVVDGQIQATGRELADLLVRLAEGAVDPEIGTAILQTAAAREATIFDDPVLRSAWQIAATRHATTVLAAANAASIVRSQPSAPVNLLPNPDFTLANGSAPADWNDLRIYSGAGVDTVAVTQAADGRDNTPCLRISTTRPSDCGVAATVPVEPGKRYRLSGWIRTANVVPMRGSDGAMLNVHGGERTAGVKGTTDWTRVAVEIDSGDQKQIVVHCLFGGYGGASGTAWFDDVALEPIGGGNTLAAALDTLAAKQAATLANGNKPASALAVRKHLPDAAVHERGAAVYSRTCIACHGFDGVGLPPTFPPLDGSDWLAGAPERAIDIVVHGLWGPITVSGTRFENVMPPLGPVLTDVEIADALTYARQRWSNDSPPVTAVQVEARRAATRERIGLLTAEELGK